MTIRAPRLGWLITDTLAQLRARWVVTLTVALTTAVTTGAVLLTVGRSVALEAAVLADVDSAGTRTIVVSDPSGRGRIPADAVARVGQVTGVVRAVGFGPLIDASRPDLPGAGLAIPIRAVVGGLPVETSVAETVTSRLDEWVIVGRELAATVGLPHGVGTLALPDGHPLAVVGTFMPAPGFEDLETIGLLVTDDLKALRSIVVLVDSPSSAIPIAAALRDVLGAERPAEASIETSEQLVAVRDAVEGRLGRFSRNLLLWALAITLILILVVVSAFVLQARRDIGRRRALGATRSSVVGMIALHVALSAAGGSAVGAAAALLAVSRSGDPIPPEFVIATAALTVLVASVAALPPALTAAFRDPVLALRTP